MRVFDFANLDKDLQELVRAYHAALKAITEDLHPDGIHSTLQEVCTHERIHEHSL